MGGCWVKLRVEDIPPKNGMAALTTNSMLGNHHLALNTVDFITNSTDCAL
jgi:hypothetical protein